jgi:hypothetical protein
LKKGRFPRATPPLPRKLLSIAPAVLGLDWHNFPKTIAVEKIAAKTFKGRPGDFVVDRPKYVARHFGHKRTVYIEPIKIGCRAC